MPGNLGIVLGTESLVEAINKEYSAFSAKMLIESIEKDEMKQSKKSKKSKKRKSKAAKKTQFTEEQKAEHLEIATDFVSSLLENLQPFKALPIKKKAKSECEPKKSKKKAKKDKAFKCFDIPSSPKPLKKKPAPIVCVKSPKDIALRKLSSSKLEERKKEDRKVSIDSIIDFHLNSVSEKKSSIEETTECSEFFGNETDAFLKKIHFGF